MRSNASTIGCAFVSLGTNASQRSTRGWRALRMVGYSMQRKPPATPCQLLLTRRFCISKIHETGAFQFLSCAALPTGERILSSLFPPP